MPIYTAEQYDREHGHKVERHPLPKDCASSNYPRLIHDEDTWKFLQRVFYEQTYARKSYHHRLVARNQGLWYSGVNGHYVEARDDGDGRGRGIYAIKDIPQNTKIWHFELKWVVNNGYWNTKEKMTNYLERLTHDLQCDVLLWAYAAVPFRRSKTGIKYVECNLDEASFINHAEQPELVNVIAPDIIAGRDIKKGEELLMDYGSFIALGEDSIPWWDEIRNTAWMEPEDEDIAGDNKDTNTISKASSSSSSAPSAETGVDTNTVCMDGYVKYGAPKSTSTSKSTSGAVFVDARSMQDAQATSYGFSSTLAGVSLAWVLAGGLAMMGMRRRR